jgi:hypothetical protein
LAAAGGDKVVDVQVHPLDGTSEGGRAVRIVAVVTTAPYDLLRTR